jgi:hypothetical protein
LGPIRPLFEIKYQYLFDGPSMTYEDDHFEKKNTLKLDEK